MSTTIPDRPLSAPGSIQDNPFAEDSLLDEVDDFEESLAADLMRRRIIDAWW